MTSKMTTVSRRLWIAFVAVLVIYSVLCLFAFVVIILFNEENKSIADAALQGVPFILSVLAGGVILYIIATLFRDVSKSVSPFTMKQSVRIRLAGVVLLADVAFEAVASLGPTYLGMLGNTPIAYGFPKGTVSMYIDAKLLIAAVVCFCLSYVFKYGALLQWLNDETV